MSVPIRKTFVSDKHERNGASTRRVGMRGEKREFRDTMSIEEATVSNKWEIRI